ncbi:hypothetical protein [Thiomicrospira microaerophila]|uniref:hypothetical protein n=1 Tax=Thiomicrospira microaerophila TaxID=406020 RepID=UPI0012FE7C92|nr:hypothetical protein [Thiomicrospira microaerophila]
MSTSKPIPIELLYYAVGIALVGLSLWLTNMAFAKGAKDKPKAPESLEETKS